MPDSESDLFPETQLFHLPTEEDLLIAPLVDSIDPSAPAGSQIILIRNFDGSLDASAKKRLHRIYARWNARLEEELKVENNDETRRCDYTGINSQAA